MSTARWDKSGLKQSVQRGLDIGRTHQEFDLQLLLDMLNEIERLEDLVAAPTEVIENRIWRGFSLKELDELEGYASTESPWYSQILRAKQRLKASFGS